MSWLDGMWATLRPLLRRRQAERELEEEFAFHLEREAEQRLASGLGPAEAIRSARVRFGGEDRFREEVRGTWTGVLFTGLDQDVKYGLRRLWQRPGFTVVALLTLGLGIGANTAIFSLVRGVLLEPLPYAEPDRLAMIWNPAAPRSEVSHLSDREVLEYRAATRSFEQIAAYVVSSANLAEGEPERVRSAYVTGNLFATLGVPPLQGRTFGEADAEPGRDEVVVLGYALWQRVFGGARDVVGRSIPVSGRPRTVVGVMPPEFRLPMDFATARPTELWVPLVIDATQELPWGSRSNFLVGRLADGVTHEQSSADLARAGDAWIAAGYVRNIDGRFNRAALPLQEVLFGGVRPALMILFGAVAVILLIACANVTHLLLARSEARRRELATQLAVGASRARLARQLLVETGVLAVLGALLGIVIALAGLQAALALAPVDVIRIRGVSADAQVLAFTVLLAVAVTILAGLAPALQLSRVPVASALAATRGDAAPTRRGVRRLLVVAETAFAVPLVIGAALLARSFAELRRVDLGFETTRVLTARVDLPVRDYPEPQRVLAFYRALVSRLRDLPGVEEAGAARLLPLAGTIGDWSITLEHRPTAPDENPNGDWQIVTPGYFETMRMKLARGRFFTAADHETAPLVAVINQTMAARYWPGMDALGKRFHLGSNDQPWIEVVGIARDVRHNAVVEEARSEMYLPHAQWGAARGDGAPQYGMTLVVRSTGDPLELTAAVRAQVRALDVRLPVSDIRTLTDVATTALAQPRFTTVLLVGFGVLALGLAAIGLYGVISFAASRRTHEMGIRVALGADTRTVAGLIMGEGLALAAAGVAVGLMASVWLTNLLASELYGVTRLDASTFGLVPAVLLAVAALASYLPARRAAKVSPLTALRMD